MKSQSEDEHNTYFNKSNFVVQFRITTQHIANVCVNWERFRNRLHKIKQKRIKKYTQK